MPLAGVGIPEADARLLTRGIDPLAYLGRCAESEQPSWKCHSFAFYMPVILGRATA